MVIPTFLDERVAVCGQLKEDDLQELAAQGFRAVVNNRPDGEALFGQPAAQNMHAAAQTAGIASHYVPVTMASLSRADVARFQEILRSSEGTVIAYCKSGYRSALLWALAEIASGRRGIDDAIARAAAAGQDLSPARAVIERLSL